MLTLGHALDPASLHPTERPATLDPAELTRHAVCVGMTGSGKTGLCVGLLESLAMQGVPVLALDPKGDLANLALAVSSRLRHPVRRSRPGEARARRQRRARRQAIGVSSCTRFAGCDGRRVITSVR
jgi:hypothetical protein